MIIQEAIQVRVDSETEGLCSNPPLPTELGKDRVSRIKRHQLVVRRKCLNCIIQREKKVSIGVAIRPDGHNRIEVKNDIGEIHRIQNSDSP